MTAYLENGWGSPVSINLKHIPLYFLRPIRLFQTYQRSALRPDLIAGLTVAVVLLPQAIAYALIAELPPQMGLYTAIVAAIVGALWGSSNQLHTGPTNAASLLVLATLLPIAAPGSPEFLAAAGLMAVMVGIFRLVMGLARLGFLVNFVKVQGPVRVFMKSTGFYAQLGADHFLADDTAIKVLDPAVCVYECHARVFEECQNLPRRVYPVDIPLHTDIPVNNAPAISSEALWQELHSDAPPIVIDVREPREFKRGHIPQAKLAPLPELLSNPLDLPRNRSVVFVCRSGRRSARVVAYLLDHNGYDNLKTLQGGILAWETAGLLEAIE